MPKTEPTLPSTIKCVRCGKDYSLILSSMKDERGRISGHMFICTVCMLLATPTINISWELNEEKNKEITDEIIKSGKGGKMVDRVAEVDKELKNKKK